ncbi:MAG: hypothetical protein HLUCCO02_09290 [Idiomarinaceae bacterium HL-53]|nr:MAG: hypothetical protein HLUCCO02_09290 [Idiomarinaceae bacterium HL-53]CUS47724.1 hypothetical protein Ga0003345_0658 [Idiomarinaceae bacterium HL-53]
MFRVALVSLIGSLLMGCVVHVNGDESSWGSESLSYEQRDLTMPIGILTELEIDAGAGRLEVVEEEVLI